MMHQSIATIDSPEFINLQPLEINPLMSSCEIKVLYLGENRNHSYITKDVAMEMAKTLRGAPIVGYYKEEKEDFRDHGEKVIFDDEGIKFECMTKPYGFVAPDAKVWFQKFEDSDDFGNKETREYLMTTGYLWTGQYEEAKLAVEEGRPQSMELDNETLDGHWATNNKTGMDFFIINDAIFSKLCILGDDVEPCFEGARITAPEVSTSFTKIDDDFKKTLYTMMQDLKFALEGGNNMDMNQEQNLVAEEVVETETVETTEEETSVVEEAVVTETPAEEPVTEFDSLKRTEEIAQPVETEATTEVEETVEEEVIESEIEEEITEAEEEVIEEETIETEEETVVEEEILAEDDNSEQSISTETQDSIEATQSSQENFAKSEDKEDEEESKEEEDNSTEEDSENNDEEDKKDYSLIEQELSDLKVAYTELETKYQALVEFKETVDTEKKDALINSFYMLSDEDKADVIENKSNYSLDEIEAKLSVICVRKKVNFDLDDTSKNDNIVEEENVTTYNLSDAEVASTPAWITALKNTRDSK